MGFLTCRIWFCKILGTAYQVFPHLFQFSVAVLKEIWLLTQCFHHLFCFLHPLFSLLFLRHLKDFTGHFSAFCECFRCSCFYLLHLQSNFLIIFQHFITNLSKFFQHFIFFFDFLEPMGNDFVVFAFKNDMILTSVIFSTSIAVPSVHVRGTIYSSTGTVKCDRFSVCLTHFFWHSRRHFSAVFPHVYYPSQIFSPSVWTTKIKRSNNEKRGTNTHSHFQTRRPKFCHVLSGFREILWRFEFLELSCELSHEFFCRAIQRNFWNIWHVHSPQIHVTRQNNCKIRKKKP